MVYLALVKGIVCLYTFSLDKAKILLPGKGLNNNDDDHVSKHEDLHLWWYESLERDIFPLFL